MERVQVQFTPDQLAALRERAAETGQSLAGVLRELADDLVARKELAARIDMILSVAGRFSSGLHDVAERHDDYIAEAIDEDMHGQ
jgi:hypothetical protein